MNAIRLVAREFFGMFVDDGNLALLALVLVAIVAAAVKLLALPPLLAPPDDVHRVTAAMFTISYTWAVVIPVIAGALWDLTGLASAAFWPIGLCGILLIVLASAINHIPRQTH